jgi:dedicated sortase system histidine kinase
MEQSRLKARIPFPSIRAQLLIISLVVLVLPWIGVQTIRDMETLLREQQVHQTMIMATTITDGLTPVMSWIESHNSRLQQTPADSEIILSQTNQSIVIDGYADDWPTDRIRQQYDSESALRSGRDDTVIEATLSSYQQNRSLILLIDISDDSLYQTRNPLQSPRDGDHVLLGLADRDGRLRQYIISSNSPGWLSVIPVDASGLQETRIQAEMQARSGGYTLEIAIPDYLSSELMSIHIVDRDNDDRADIAIIGNVPLDITITPGLVFGHIIDISQQLEHYRARGQRLSLVDRRGNILARNGEIHSEADVDSSVDKALLERLQDMLLLADTVTGQDDMLPYRLQDDYVNNALNNQADYQYSRDNAGTGLLSVATPLLIDGQPPVAALIIQQSTDAISGIRYQALFNITLTSLSAMAIVIVVLLAYATILIKRIRSLNRQMQSSVSDDGRLSDRLKVSLIDDEIGELNRGMVMMIERLQSYQQYLESMASKLSHELRTPLTVVQSSLENLQSESDQLSQHPLISRAQDGLARLKMILANLTEASRLENALKTTGVELFDLCAVIDGCVKGYQQAFPAITFEYSSDVENVKLRGSAELMAQLMDKLVGNAMDFHRPGTPVNIRISNTHNGCQLSVCNQGEPIPEGIINTMFDSMVSARAGTTNTPHMGLGLYIVRLIAAYHGATPVAKNTDGEVCVCVLFDGVHS